MPTFETVKPSRAAKRILAAATLALSAQLFISDHASGATRTWTNPAGGTFQTGGNWTGGNAPVTLDNALFNLASAPGYVVTFNGSVSNTALNVANDNLTFQLNAATYTLSASANVGVNTNDLGRLTLNNGTLTAQNINVATNSGTSGTLTLGAAATVVLSGVLTVGGQGSGTLSIANGADIMPNSAIVGSSSAGSGTLIVSGVGSTLQPTTTTSVGNGNVQVLSGGVLSDIGSSLGTVANGTASVFVSGSGSTWADSGTLVVGATAGGIANFTVDSGGLLSTVGATVGLLPGSVGTPTVTGAGSRWINSGSLDVRHGTLNVVNGGTMSSSGVFVATSAGSTGASIRVHGPGSAMNCGTALLAAGLDVPITVDAGATLAADQIVTGFVADSTNSDLTVDGLGSAATSSVGGMQIASAVGSRSTLRVTNGATVVAPGLSIAVGAGSTGTVLVSTGGAQLASLADANIGGSSGAAGGAALVSVESGATLLTSPTQPLRIWAAGTLRIAGGTVSVGTLSMLGGAFQWDSGTLRFSGASGLNISVGAPLGDHPTLASAHDLSVVNNLNVAPNAALTLDGGSVQAGSVTNSAAGEIVFADETSAITAPVNNSGLIRGDGRISGTLTNNFAGEVRAEYGKRLLFDNGTTSTPHSDAGQLTLFGGVLEFAQPLNVTSTGRITGRGTLIARGAGISNAGTITFSAGTSDVPANIANNAAAKVIVTGGSTTTFFQPIVTTVGSEIRVSTNSTAVFLGDVTGAGTFTGPGTKDFEAGGSGLMITSAIGRTIVGPGASITTTTIRDASVQVEGSAAILPNGSSSATSVIGSLTIEPGGTLDLNDNDLLCTSTPKASIESFIHAARNAGAWDQPGLTSSAARNQSSHSTTLGVLSGQEYLAITGGSTFDGIASSLTDVLVKYTWNGDANFSGTVNFDDYVRLDVGFNTHLTGWANGDFNYSGAIDFDDYVLIDVAFNTQSGTLGRAVKYLTGDDRSGSGRAAPGVEMVVEHFERFGLAYAQHFLASVPEPHVWSAFICAGCFVGCRKRRAATLRNC